MTHFIHITSPSQGRQVIDSPGEHVIYFRDLSLDLDVDIAHPEARVYIYGLYTARDTDRYTLTTRQHHTVPGGYSDLLVKGVFDDRSSLDYSGYIRIERDCDDSHAYQKNQNLLLSPRARVTSIPNLEILSPQVYCTHGSTTGRPSREQLHYMMTRGLDQGAARDLYVQGFVADLLARIPGHSSSDDAIG